MSAKAPKFGGQSQVFHAAARTRCHTCGRFTASGQTECRRCISRRARARCQTCGRFVTAGETQCRRCIARRPPIAIEGPVTSTPISVAPAQHSDSAAVKGAPVAPSVWPTAFVARTRTQYVVPRPSELHVPPIDGTRIQARPSSNLGRRSSRRLLSVLETTWTGGAAETVFRLLTVVVVGAIAIGAVVVVVLSFVRP